MEPINTGLEFNTAEVLRGYGGINAKENLYVEFYPGEIESQFTKDENGNFLKKKCDFIRIRIGQSTDIYEAPVNDEHKKRFAEQYNRYMEGRRGFDHIDGTKLEEWGVLTPAKMTELKAMGFYTIEQIAKCSDASLPQIGFDGAALRKDAIKILESKKSEGTNAEIEALKAQIAALTKLVQAVPDEEAKPKAKTKSKEKSE